ncbi:hypothetical protein MC7420_3412 [Coleofasciculus chthonoplastes PCC 7420]|uniref:Uncharacterized protein n=1 Tax=Coleofasciculus chthonoplastes PCC 7420 TaxID=118168 RepID=B4W3G5_9CYAN|nr:hypothetical protein [Coleofasciculus chthonoplastes]EDX71297.1 hypothetical protein MC7420_3412 [Coleofasciculus chthonoplastes PCC 7420]
MLPSPQDPERADTPVQSKSSSQASELSGVDTEQMFRLIDSILPFEACLFHQFLPLSLEGKYLKLGIVDTHDSTALDYVRRILAFMNCSLKVEQITANTHTAMLSAYLNQGHRDTAPKRQRSERQQSIPRSEQATLIIDDASLAEDEANQPEPSTPSPQAAAQKHNSTPVASQSQPSDAAHLTEDETTEPQPSTSAANAAKSSQPPTSHEVSQTENEAVQPEESKAAAKTNNNSSASESHPTLIIDDIRQLQDELNQSSEISNHEDSQPSTPTPQPTSQSSNHSPAQPPPLSGKTVSTQTALTPVFQRSLPTKALLPLDVNPVYLSRPIAFLATLAPHQIVEELLGRLLQGGIGRLYFQRQSERGRVVLRQDSSSQSVLDKLSVSVFEDIIIELKRLVNLPLQPITQPKQIESERLYQQESLLLCLRLVPGTHGEEATLQLLRGAPLNFYQQQKVERLGQEAIKLAGQLQHKLNEIRDRSYRYSIPPVETLPTLNQLLHHLDTQLETLMHNPMDQQDN